MDARIREDHLAPSAILLRELRHQVVAVSRGPPPKAATCHAQCIETTMCFPVRRTRDTRGVSDRPRERALPVFVSLVVVAPVENRTVN
jgi:hypothetical protein